MANKVKSKAKTALSKSINTDVWDFFIQQDLTPEEFFRWVKFSDECEKNKDLFKPGGKCVYLAAPPRLGGKCVYLAAPQAKTKSTNAELDKKLLNVYMNWSFYPEELMNMVSFAEEYNKLPEKVKKELLKIAKDVKSVDDILGNKKPSK